MKIVSRASRPGSLVGFLHILCNGLCTAQRFHTEEHEHTCRVGCPNEHDSLTHYNECPKLCNILVSLCRKNHSVKIHNNFSKIHSKIFFFLNEILSGRGGRSGVVEGCNRGRVRGMEGRGLWVE